MIAVQRPVMLMGAGQRPWSARVRSARVRSRRSSRSSSGNGALRLTTARYYTPSGRSIRTGEHPERHLQGYGGILQAAAYAGFNRLYDGARKPGPLIEAACWSHSRRKFFVLADVTARARGKPLVIAPLALEAVKRIDAIFAIEREINGRPADERLAVRRERLAPLVAALEVWMCSERGKLSRHSEVAKAMDSMLKRWTAFTRFLADGRICLSNNAAERELRGIALGRESWR